MVAKAGFGKETRTQRFHQLSGNGKDIDLDVQIFAHSVVVKEESSAGGERVGIVQNFVQSHFCVGFYVKLGFGSGGIVCNVPNFDSEAVFAVFEVF